MALFEKYPKDVRKMIAISVTAVVGITLVVVMALMYISKSKDTLENDKKPSKITDFYNTISEKGVLLFQK